MTLANCEERHAQYPERFWIPDLTDRQSLRVGDYAKVIFESDEGGERMWVKVTQIMPGSRYEGLLANTPIVFDMEKGNPVAFGPENIADIMPVVSVQ